MSAKVTSKVPPVVVPTVQMRPGQIGTFTYGGEKVLGLRTYDELVDLNHPVRTWEATASFQIELLPEGTTIELTVETFTE